MENLEKVKKGLKCCSNCSGEDCSKCPYQNEAKGEAPTCTAHLSADALKILNEFDPIALVYYGKAPHCKECGRLLYDEWIACPICGKRVDWDAGHN